MIPAAFLLSFVHETGHCVIALSFGWKITEYHVSFFPFDLSFSEAYVVFLPRPGAIEAEIILVALGGSLATFVTSLLFFLPFYKLRLHPFLEMFFFCYNLLFFMEMVAYIIIDLFFLKNGDWYFIYQLKPWLVGLFLVGGMTSLVLYTIYFKKILRRLDFMPCIP